MSLFPGFQSQSVYPFTSLIGKTHPGNKYLMYHEMHGLLNCAVKYN